MQATPEDTRKALLKLLSTVASPSGADVDETRPAGEQINLCIERTKAEASEGAALIDACAPHGRAVFNQAQQRLEHLQRLKLLKSLASFGLL
jgi:hypothetical protein